MLTYALEEEYLKTSGYKESYCWPSTAITQLPAGVSQMYPDVYIAFDVWVLSIVYSAITQTMKRNSGREEQLKTGLSWSGTCLKSLSALAGNQGESLQLKTEGMCFPFFSHPNSIRYSSSIWLATPRISFIYCFPFFQRKLYFLPSVSQHYNI